ncbi:MAG: class E sortase [Actinomycetota bacterium]|nr:class E sortase [Actinomycetota bacterium]
MRKTLRTTGSVFITLGVLILYFVVYEIFGTSLQTHAHQRALQKEFAAILDDPRSHLPDVPTASPTPAAPTAKPGVHGIAELIIPSIGIDDIVVQGVTLYALAYGPGHYPDSADIGAKGTAAIAGHRTGWGSPFYNLNELGTGDTVILKTVHGTFTYRVTRGNVVVHADDYQVIRGDPNSDAETKLTLTTCTPRYTSKNRLIVWADLIKAEPVAA